MSTKPQLLIIDDEEAIRDMVKFSLEKYQFKIDGCPDCASAERYLQQSVPDLILLDWMLPEKSGIEFAKSLRAQASTQHIPIIMLTAKAEEANKVRGLEEAKADDYVTKPFSPRELAARINSVLRRSVKQQPDDIFTWGPLRLDFAKRQVSVAEQAVELTAKQFNLLYFFITHPNKVYTRQQLVEVLSQTNDYIDERSIDRQVKRLRDALMPFACEQMIETVRGHGYTLVSQP